MTKIIDRTGEEKINNFGSVMIIKEYRNYDDIDVHFPKYNFTKEHVQYDKFKKGEISCIYERRTYGVGYIGNGKYVASINGKHTKCYMIWKNMLRRCYDPKSIEKRPTYKGCEVSPEWHDFQVFSDWFQTNYYEIEDERMALDKDILCKGNKIYSPDTCIFVPNKINTLFIKSNGSRGDYPVGVYYNKSNKKYIAQCKINEKQKHLGCYDTPEEAFQVYKNFKEKYIKEVAEEYKNKIPQKLYDAMINYRMEIND